MEKTANDGVPGWRGTLGWVSPAVPASSAILDFHSVVPEGIELRIINLGITALNDKEVEMAMAKVDEAVRRLTAVGVQFISIEGTPLVSTRGFGSDKEMIKRAEEIAKVPVTTSLTAAVDALNALKLKKLVMASPMPHEFDRRAKKFMEDSGFEIIHVKSLNLAQNRERHALPRNAAYVLAKQAYLEAPEAEGIYIPCGGWCPTWCIDMLERDLGVPAIHSRQAVTWAGLKALHIKDPVKGWGRIFRTLYE